MIGTARPTASRNCSGAQADAQTAQEIKYPVKAVKAVIGRGVAVFFLLRDWFYGIQSWIMKRGDVFLMCLPGGGLDVCAAPLKMLPPGGKQPGVDVLASWAEGLRPGRAGVQGQTCLRFAFYGRVSTEDWQDPVTSRARQLQQAMMLIAGVGVIVAEFFDTGSSGRCRGRGARRPLLWSLSSPIRAGAGTRS